ncbi:MAG: hypothetical protein WAN51_08755 [Alphaproteobacteria bacterium]
MTTKTKVVERLGEKAVLLPALIGDALAANDRIKLRLSLLQEAASHARTPNGEPRSFRAERQAAGLDTPSLDSFVAGARALSPTRLFMPGASELVAGMIADLSAMLAPLQLADNEAGQSFVVRTEALTKSLPAAEGDQLDLGDIDNLASASRTGRDSVHVLVMDLHKALNRLAADTALETLDGARVHRLDERDRARVKAFMRGLNRTAPLAFGHPGLGTTAVRANGRLTIQNDIGTTDAHVLVVHVEDKAVTVIYTDIHRPRAKFFISLFDGQGVAWSPLAEQNANGLGEDVFYLLTGRYASDDDGAVERFLEFLGSRIVFLIDWNKARKALQTFVGKNAAIGLLSWAAGHDFGHRAFLDLGGADLIFEAVHRAAAGRIPYGVRLDQALGASDCVDFLRRVLRDASQGLSAGRTARLIRDEIQADLSRQFETAESSVLTVLVRHLGLTRTLAAAISNVLSAPGSVTRSERRALAYRAKLIEEKGDRLTVSARETAARVREAGMLRPVIDEVEKTTDELEDCAFLLSLVPEADASVLAVAPLAQLSEIVTDSVGDLIRAVEAASRLPEGQRADAVASLQAIDAVVNAERSADAAERDIFAALMAGARSDARPLVLGLEIARALETATDHLSHSALSLRDRVLEELSA